jgi:hypothetical protein
MEIYPQKVCPKCGSDEVYEALYGVTVFRRVSIIEDNDWDILDEEIHCDDPQIIRYECYKCDHIYNSTDIESVIEEMIYEEDYKDEHGRS